MNPKYRAFTVKGCNIMLIFLCWTKRCMALSCCHDLQELNRLATTPNQLKIALPVIKFTVCLWSCIRKGLKAACKEGLFITKHRCWAMGHVTHKCLQCWTVYYLKTADCFPKVVNMICEVFISFLIISYSHIKDGILFQL